MEICRVIDNKEKNEKFWKYIYIYRYIYAIY